MTRELGDAAMNPEAHRLNVRWSFLTYPGQLTRLLGHPDLIGMSGTAREMDPSCAKLDKKQNVHPAQAEGFDRQEIAG